MTDPRHRLAASLGGLDEDVPTALQRLSEMGYSAVHLPISAPGLRPRDLDATARRGLRTLLRRRELQLAGMDLWIPPGDFVEPSRSDRAASAVMAAIELSADLGRSSGGGSPGDRRAGISLLLPVVGDHDDALRSLLAALFASAERHGVDLIDCTHPPQRSAHSGEVRWCVGIDPPAWLSTEGVDLTAAMVANAQTLRSVRLVDLSRSGMRVPIADRACGSAWPEARLDPDVLAGGLSAVAPQALPVADPRQWIDPWGGLAQTLAVWSRALRASPAAPPTR